MWRNCLRLNIARRAATVLQCKVCLLRRFDRLTHAGLETLRLPLLRSPVHPVRCAIFAPPVLGDPFCHRSMHS